MVASASVFFLRWARAIPVSAASSGATVVVQGRVVARGLVRVTGQSIDCVYHQTLVEQWRTGVRGGRAMWTVAGSDEELEPFEIEDESGRILVWPEDGRVSVRGGRSERGMGKTAASRFVTRYIAPGDIVRVRGGVRAPKTPKKGKVRADREISSPERGDLVILFRRKGLIHRP